MHNIFRDEEKRIEHIAHSLKQVWRQVLSIKEDKKLNISSTAHLGRVGCVQRERKSRTCPAQPTLGVVDMFRGRKKQTR
jgi:hypothetical protein